MTFGDTARLYHKYHHMILESFGIYRGQHRLFFALNEKQGPISQTSLARIMNISASTLTRMVQSLEKKGFVMRHTDEKDQRQTLISLTPEGQAIHDRIKELFIKTDESMFHSFTEEEQEKLRDFLGRIQIQLQERIRMHKGGE